MKFYLTSFLVFILIFACIPLNSSLASEVKPSGTKWRISIRLETETGEIVRADFLNYDKEFSPQLSQEPFLVNGRVLVPLRQISEALGYSVQWQPNGGIIKLYGKNLHGEDVNVEMKVDQNAAIVNNKAIPLDVPPRIVNGNTMIPLRFISETLGCFVKYSSNTPFADIYITDYPLLESNEIPQPGQNDGNYYADGYGYPHLRPGGQTSRGIKLGDSIEKVLAVYPRGKSYPNNFSGNLCYEDWIPYQCGSYALVFEFNNGILVDVYATN
jgi:hypothetical protein